MSYHPVEKQIIYKGRKVHVEVHRVQNEAGRESTREVVVHPGAVVILPLLSPSRIVLIRNRRYSIRQSLLELPAGTLEKGEPPINCAGRELQEETGYIAGRLQPLGAFFSSPGILTEKLYAFAAYDLEKSKTALQDDEEIENREMEFDQAIEMIRTGEIADAKTIATLLLFDRFHRAR
jgi:ADP-ribose pyrophosphatase